jgi:large subunit ribosomal protein L24
MALKIRIHDKVIVISGKDRGKIGIVKKILSAEKIIVQGINIVTKHIKPIPAENKLGGIKKIEAYIHISNVALLNPHTNRPDKIGFKFDKGKKIRFFKSNNLSIK